MVVIADRDDMEAVSRQLHRRPRGFRRVVSRCALGCPQVVENEVFLEEGQPFPTLYWLTCPAKVKAVSRLEGEGWSEELQGRVKGDGLMRERLYAAQQDYKERRRIGAVRLNHPVFATGIGGVKDIGAIKCLHAHYAHYLATGNNPVGEMVHDKIGETECNERCDNR